jgi:hypothetical protein
MPVTWTDQEMRTFAEQLGPLGVPLEAALAVYTAESGLDPKASSGIAFGIAQLTGRTLKGLGWLKPAKDFGQLSVSAQAPWIAKLVASQARMIGFVPKNALELYVANFKPAAAKAGEDVLYRQGQDAYAKNINLDRDRKGFIDRHDLQVSLNRAEATETYKRAIAQLAKVRTS